MIIYRLCYLRGTDRSLLAEHLETLALDGGERLLAGGRSGLAEGHLRNDLPALRKVPRRENLLGDERAVVLEGGTEALLLERGPNDELEHALCARSA